MHDLNSVLIEGTVDDRPELLGIETGTGVCVFSILSRHIEKNGTSTETHNSVFPVEVRGTLGRNCAEYLTKGRAVRIVGRLVQDRSSVEGDGHARTKVVAEHVEFRPAKRSVA